MIHKPKTPLPSPSGLPIYYQGPDLSIGPMPALFYFALSGSASLYEDPFNQPITALSENPIRIFSWDLPFHGEGFDPKEAMQAWAHEFMHNVRFLPDFIGRCLHNIEYLIQQEWIDPQHMAVAGLSRGGFIATHLAAHYKRFKYVLGFAPLTRPHPVEELAHLTDTRHRSIDLVSLVEHLISHHIRFYIGNHDTRVGTDSCFEFIKALADTAFSNGVRSPNAELIIYPSIGYKGHGTPSFIFQQGAHWIKTHLLNK